MSSATMTLIGMYNYRDDIFNELVLPTGIDADLFKNARSVVCDMNSRVWIGTAYNLYAYLPDTGTFTIFGYSDGAYPNDSYLLHGMCT